MGNNKKILGIERDSFMLFMRRYGIAFIMVVMVIALALAQQNFFTGKNIISIFLQISVNGILAMGMIFVITAGGIDLSIGSLLALTSVMCGQILRWQDGRFWYLAFVVPVIITTFFGFINGYLIAKFKIFPFVVTLATQLVARGLSFILSGGYQIPITNMSFLGLGTYRIFGVIPIPVVIMITITVLMYSVLHHTKFGRHIYATGGNINAATASGVNTMWVTAKSFIISGFCAGVAGVILTSRVTAGMPNIGVGYEGDAIAANVIGGTSFAGGISTVPGTFVGTIIIGLIYNGMNMLQINTNWQTIVKGLLILAAVMLDMFMNKRRK
jgi:Ribose/xylose/arabinose/galactoside ABC-type transport systems, permease components